MEAVVCEVHPRLGQGLDLCGDLPQGRAVGAAQLEADGVQDNALEEEDTLLEVDALLGLGVELDGPRGNGGRRGRGASDCPRRACLWSPAFALKGKLR